MPVADYLRLYDTSWRELHESDIGLDSYEDRSLYSTWRISLDRIEQQNGLSAKLLGLWCYFSNRDLWYELVSAGPSEDIPWIQQLTSSLHVFSQAMRLLCNYGLVEREVLLQEKVDSGGYSIHSCVHSWVIHALNAQWDPILARYAIDATARRIPREDDGKPWVTQRRLLQHVDRCVEHVKGQSAIKSNMEWELCRFGDLYADQGKLAEAEEMYERALKGYEKALGADHTSTLTTVNNLGLLYADQGKLAEAEEMYERALKGYKASPFTKKGQIRQLEQRLLAIRRDQGSNLCVTIEHMYKPNSCLGTMPKLTVDSVPDAHTYSGAVDGSRKVRKRDWLAHLVRRQKS
jgi:hypothetical protein